MTLPIFVIGRNRSGTTWLANQLCRHPDVAGVQHERHHGIHESAYFGWVDGRYGDLRERVNFMEFVRAIAPCDYFRLAGADEDFLYSLYPATYAEVFRAVMDRFARSRGATDWLEKADVQEGPVAKAMAAYPDARFVGIYREPVTNTASKLRLAALAGQIGFRPWTVFRMSLAWAYTTKILKAMAKRAPDRVLLVRYEDLKADTEGTLRRVCDFLDLRWDPELAYETYRPNTSFASETQRRSALSRTEKLLIRIGATVGQWIPRSLLRLGFRFRQWRKGRQMLPRWFYRLHPFFEAEGVETADAISTPAQAAEVPAEPEAEPTATSTSSRVGSA